MRKSLLSLAVLSALSLPSMSYAEDAPDAHSHPAEKGTAPATAPAIEPGSPHTFTYNIGLYSQYIFRGLTQTDNKPAIQGGVDYSHSSGFYAGTWASNISWLEDGGNYKGASLEWDIYGGYRNTIGETGIGYDVGLLNYIYPGSKTDAGRANAGFDDPYTLEAYGALSYKWLQAKLSYALTNDVFGTTNADNTYYAELNANIPVGETGITANLHIGRQHFGGSTAGVSNNGLYSYTDYKIGATKSWSNGVNVGAYYTDTNAKDAGYTYLGNNIGDSTFTAFIQKTF
ncbi:MAG: TorF family putative porin [Methylotenera sp.]